MVYGFLVHPISTDDTHLTVAAKAAQQQQQQAQSSTSTASASSTSASTAAAGLAPSSSSSLAADGSQSIFSGVNSAGLGDGARAELLARRRRQAGGGGVGVAQDILDQERVRVVDDGEQAGLQQGGAITKKVSEKEQEVEEKLGEDEPSAAVEEDDDAGTFDIIRQANEHYKAPRVRMKALQKQADASMTKTQSVERRVWVCKFYSQQGNDINSVPRREAIAARVREEWRLLTHSRAPGARPNLKHRGIFVVQPNQLFDSPKTVVWQQFGDAAFTLICEPTVNVLLAANWLCTFIHVILEHFGSFDIFSSPQHFFQNPEDVTTMSIDDESVDGWRTDNHVC
eukprot:TRINITY_DN66313_c4_g1_i2.p1 TRINITY_DN66313_c4_g1~~TRINITY_DN66313_c4_g1_i2.p1  ORF type:complete len:341 (+),score=139.78 TRINITY_DN66313_c4_g1_i2:153-1175(+)